MTFNELSERISPKLRAISSKLNYRDAYFDADDLYQEALIHLWESYESGKLRDKTESYIVQGCFFFLKNYIRVVYKRIDGRSTSIEALASRDEGEGARWSDGGVAVSDDRQFGFMVVDILVDDIASALSGRAREVFLLSLEEMTTREIGSRLGISHAMVVKIEKRIRARCEEARSELLSAAAR